MHKRFYTIGMAGHIDHGKTALTKALTEVDTDRLKEEKERNISIEPGFAPLKLQNHDWNVSIIDVPGHEKFIRQMIAGVAGIDLVIIVIAGDEGIMPQTREHMDILSLLGVEEAILVVTKADLIDEEMEELVEEDIRSYVKGKSYERAELLFVDSLSGRGIYELEQLIGEKLSVQPTRDASGAFRMPVDQSFTIKGQGTIVRGTIFEGSLRIEDRVLFLPQYQQARIRQIEVHHTPVIQAFAGQRAAVNITGLGKEDVKRGDVMVKSDAFITTQTLDVRITLVDHLLSPIKQRAPVNVYIGTAQAAGKIVFFDRNEVTESSEEIFCQLRLNEPVVAKRSDRFILRRPTPVETIGGGVVIEAGAEKHRFGVNTVEMLKEKSKTTPEERLIHLLHQTKWMDEQGLWKDTAMDPKQLKDMLQTNIAEGRIIVLSNGYMLKEEVDRLLEDIAGSLKEYHDQNPLRAGKNKAELIAQLPLNKPIGKRLMDYWLKKGELKAFGQYFALPSFAPYFPKEWADHFHALEKQWRQDGLEVKTWNSYGVELGVPDSWMQELKLFYLQQNLAWELDGKHLVHIQPVRESFEQLYHETEEAFSLKEAKEVFQVSRKYLVPLLENGDEAGVTIRIENGRKWLKQPSKILSNKQEAD
ncbi:selenocysteine-specific translation elongation factor [Thalassobacillus devorans]|uniref:Selenocysteine-specific elongation factor n=1 Tax=Thalassobacillus devorans TaxID=279813 RepID=A0ABQ1P0Q5_9BACI|nr:selenocysteine-specific translation elongation factor [Thalassobacillus devorans]NIK28098.1 selenocysteine-specific elongation factor [Thalassobacillus devorans]GGC88866.1 selenocysteine-specific translation elongation factor [Thalassobacillus devorans]